MSLLTGKYGLIFGVANKRSIAWAIAQAWHEAGAKLAFTYQADRQKEDVAELIDGWGEDIPLMRCDVARDEDISAVFQGIQEKWGRLDLLLHSVAFAPREALEGGILGTTREAFRMAQDISVYSLVAFARGAAPLMTDGGSILAMTFHGSEKVMPHYNVMGVAKAALEACVRYLAVDLGPHGIRVNAISAGPVRTLAASGVKDFKTLHRQFRDISPMRTAITIEDVGATALYLTSDMSRAVTGEVVYVDGGYNIIGVPNLEA
jgi:enoyl-[acyl-carrier protein] reductase I